MPWRSDRDDGHEYGRPYPEYELRCLHVEYGFPADEEGETHARCIALFPWDGSVIIQERAFCPRHRHLYVPTDHRMNPVQLSQVKALHGQVAEQMAVPAEDEKPDMRVTGPGVNAAWYREAVTHIGSTAWMVDHRERREILVRSGWEWQVAEAVWLKGKRALTEEQIDTMDVSLLKEYVGR